MKFSPQAIGSLLMTLQKCLAEQKDITEMLSDWNLSVKEDQIYVDNPPTFEMNTIQDENKNSKFVFETE